MGLAYRVAGQIPEAIRAFTNHQAANAGRVVTDLIATHVRLDKDSWTGHRSTAFFNLLKFCGRWQDVG